MTDYPEGKKTLILVVDDNQENVRVLTSILNHHGYDIIAAFNGSDALTMASRRKPDLILMDIMMPEMDGFEATRSLKEDPELKEIPVIFISALTEVEDKIQGFDVGGQDYITKPFQHQEVMARVDLHVRLYHLEKERVKNINKLEEQKKQLEKLNEAKDEIIRIVSHDMRNPLNGIIGVSTFLREDDVPEEDFDELLEMVENSGKQLLDIVNNLLDAAVLDAENVKLNRKDVEIAAVLKKAVDLQRPNAQTKKIKLVREVDDDIPTVSLDPAIFSQIVGNLLSNAIKFTPDEGEVKVSATTESEPDSGADHLLVSVTDNGIGIPEKYQATLFDRYGKHLREGTKGEKSSGLGMSIVKQFVEAHDGTIEVDSEEGEGTVFTIKVPMANGQ